MIENIRPTKVVFDLETTAHHVRELKMYIGSKNLIGAINEGKDNKLWINVQSGQKAFTESVGFSL